MAKVNFEKKTKEIKEKLKVLINKHTEIGRSLKQIGKELNLFSRFIFLFVAFACIFSSILTYMLSMIMDYPVIPILLPACVLGFGMYTGGFFVRRK